VDSFYTRPVVAKLSQDISLKGFWQGAKPLPNTIEPSQPATIPAMLIKKAGIFLRFGKNKIPLLMRKNILKSL
jgi:hypothetical protein